MSDQLFGVKFKLKCIKSSLNLEKCSEYSFPNGGIREGELYDGYDRDCGFKVVNKPIFHYETEIRWASFWFKIL